MVTFLTGVVGGLVATLSMTVAMLAVRDDTPPPSAQFYAKYVGDGTPDMNLLPGLALHFAYGAGAAAVLILVVDAVGRFGFGAAVDWLLWAVAWSAVLAVVGVVVWMRVVLDSDPDTEAVRTFAMVHAVYGVVLGLWLGLVGFP